MNVVGAGLAGSEAAWTLVRLGIPVRLFEMRPKRMTPAHGTDRFAEIVFDHHRIGFVIVAAIGIFQNFDALRAFDQHLHRTVGQLQQLQNLCRDADIV